MIWLPRLAKSWFWLLLQSCVLFNPFRFRQIAISQPQILWTLLQGLFRSHATTPLPAFTNSTSHRHPHEKLSLEIKSWGVDLQPPDYFFFMIFQMVNSETFNCSPNNNHKIYACIWLCGGGDGEGRPTSATYPWVVSVDLQNRMSTARKKSCRQNHGTDIFCMQK